LKVFASRRFPPRVREELERSFELDLHDSEWPLEREEVLARVAGCDGLMLMLTDRVDDELLDAAGPQLRIVANYAVGVTTSTWSMPAPRHRRLEHARRPHRDDRRAGDRLILALLRRSRGRDRLIRRGEGGSGRI
jgi:glyoxylate reductase